MEPNHYTSPLFSWIFSGNINKLVQLVYQYTGMNFNNWLEFDEFEDELNKFALIFVSTLLIFGVFMFWLQSFISTGILFTTFVIVSRVLLPPLNFRIGTQGYMDDIITFEKMKFGKQVTPLWFLFLWYGIFRRGNWSNIHFVMGTIFQLAMLYVVVLYIKDPVLLVIGFSLYNAFVYRNELVVLD